MKLQLRSKSMNSFKFIMGMALAASMIVTPETGRAVHILHTATTFADNAEDDRVGIEVEFTGLKLSQALKIVQEITGGTVVKKEKIIKTTLKEITDQGMVFNEAKIPEWVIEDSSIGELTIKIDNNQVTDESELDPAGEVLELVTAPIRRAQIRKLQTVLDQLKAHGAKGTADGEAVSIQYNTEVNKGDISTYKWENLINLMRVYLGPKHREQIDPHLKIPQFRIDYIGLYSPGFMARLMDLNYRPSSRELFDDFFYRQSLELLGVKDAWTMDLEKAQKLLLSQSNPVVPRVVKQNKLRISSLLAMAYPDDPIVKVYRSSGWISPMPVVEWREFNNDFNVWDHYREVMGLTYMAQRYGAFDHDRLMSQLSGVEESTIRELRQKSFEQVDKKTGPVIFRYFLGDPKTVNRNDYKNMAKAYEPHTVGFLPFYEHGQYPLSIPGESVVLHRNQFHRLNIFGKYNVGLINGFIMQALENKYVEMRFWNEYAKEGIPASNLVSEMGVKPLSAASSAEILAEVKDIVSSFNARFPNGWVLKGLFDLGTEKDIISDKTNLVLAVETYLKGDFEAYRRKITKEFDRRNAAPEYVLSVLKEHPGYKGWKVLQLLKNDKTVMIQERFNIKKEFRVEVVAGQVLSKGSTVDRYAYTHVKSNGKYDSKFIPPTVEEIQTVEGYAKRLVESLPVELRGMTFGMDVALVDGGKAVLIESNPGANSNFLYEEDAASVKALSKFLSDVPSMSKEGKIHPGLRPQEQMSYLKNKFSAWGIDVVAMYPGMKFLADKIEDADFEKGSASRSGKAMRCEGVFL